MSSYILSKSLGYLRLVRPANLLTAVADILAGIAVSGFLHKAYTNYLDLLPVACLCLATIGLYGGGVVFNDVFDASLDKKERPERPIPSGLVTKTQAVILGSYLFLVGILAAFAVGRTPGYIAVAIMTAALVYDKWGKHASWGPVNMGLCRGLNLLLGISLVEPVLRHYTWLAVIPVIYIAAVTAISRGEVYGGSISTLRITAVCYAFVYGTIGVLAVVNNHLLPTLPFLILMIIMINAPLIRAMKDPSGPNIGKAVKGGILALIAMDAAWAAAFGTWPYALLILLLLPLSILLAKAFAVT
ncbi:MAG TPA: UbiA-like protein EboC [Chitinophaga sp.]|uniref:UbiA-like protein EboC n=1 Tax=Chitinophaga sp. TaxID=1869181 RepID=UPI002DBCBB11|nr:UbiA-like protein EboC [Chitinophaga sp.]HEU4554684.1 UbiA-like protein EboC [Chitinophaga sp.]